MAATPVARYKPTFGMPPAPTFGPPSDPANISPLAGAKPQTAAKTNQMVRTPLETLTAGATATPARPASKPGTNRVASMQQFLRSKGYDVQVDGVHGPLTSAAAADWRSSRNPGAWNLSHQNHGVAAAAAAGPAATDASSSGAQTQKPAAKTSTARATATAAGAGGTATPTDPQTEARDQVMAILQPLIDQINKSATARSASGQAAIAGYGNDAMKQLAGINMQAPYAGAAAGANAVNDAELAALTGQGNDLAANVGGKLAALGQDPSSVAAGIGATTHGAAGADYAKGGATVQSLLAQGAAAGSYGRKLPGIEALAGLQASKGLEGQIASETSKQLGDIAAQAPGLIQTTMNNLHTQQSQDKALKINAILASGYDPATGTLSPAARTALAGIVGTDPTALSGGSASTVRAAASGAAKTAAAAAAAGKINPGVSKILHYAATADGTPVLTKDGKIIPVSATGAQGTPKVPSAKDLDKLVTSWHDGTIKSIPTPQYPLGPDGKPDTTQPPLTDSNHAIIYKTQASRDGQIGYQEGYRRLRAMGITDQAARQHLNTVYQRGENGRGWLTNEQQTALKNAGLTPRASKYKTVHILTKDQVTALKQAHLSPPGEWAGNYFVIAEGY